VFVCLTIGEKVVIGALAEWYAGEKRIEHRSKVRNNTIFAL
jgi:hypothetical protein